MNLEPLLATALAAARDAIAVHREHLGRVEVRAWSEKGTADFVSYVDHEAERAIVERIRADWPGHQVLAEEAASRDGDAVPHDAEALWVIDPLDGTTNYLHGYPQYAASVAFVQRGEPAAGAIVSGVTGEAWTAVRGGGAFRDGAPIRVSAIERLESALLGTGFPFKIVDRLPEYQAQFAYLLRHSAGIRRAGAAALDLCAVASGQLDGFWELYLAPWDMAAGALIVREAGGIVTGLDGGAARVGHGPIVAGNPYIHARLIAGLADAAARPDGDAGTTPGAAALPHGDR